MNSLIFRTRWETTLLHRNNLLVVSFVVTLLYLGLFQLLKMLGFVELFAILLVLNDPAVIGLLFVGVTVIFERDQGTLAAMQVTPMSYHSYLLGKVIVLGLLGTVCAWIMAVGSVGFDIRHGHFLLTNFLISAIFSHLGLVVVARSQRFLDFTLRSVGFLIFMTIPLFDWFGVFTVPFIEAFPLEHGVRLMAYSFHFQIETLPWTGYLVLLAAAGLSYAWAYRRMSTSKL